MTAPVSHDMVGIELIPNEPCPQAVGGGSSATWRGGAPCSSGLGGNGDGDSRRNTGQSGLDLFLTATGVKKRGGSCYRTIECQNRRA